MGFFDAMGDTISLIKYTFVIVGRNPAIVKPTVIQAVLAVVSLLLLVIGIVAFASLGSTFAALATPLIVLFFILLFFVLPFIGTYLRAAQCWMVYGTFTGIPVNAGSGFARANKKMGGIFLITVIDFVVNWLATGLRSKSGNRKGVLGFIVAIVLSFAARALEESWDLIGNYLLPAYVIEDKKAGEVIRTLPNIKNNIPGALVGVFGIDFVGGAFMGGLALLGIVLLLVGAAIGFFFQTWIPFLLLFVIVVMLLVIASIFVNMVKTIYFTLFYVAVTRPTEIKSEFRDEVTNYLTYSRKHGTAQQVSTLIQQGMGKPVANQPSPKKETAEEIAEKIVKLIPYIEQYRAQGMNDEQIVKFLTDHEWPEYIVRKALQHT